jgi:large subunit ribosomal protein L25
MEQHVIEVERRTADGKGAARKMRRTGKIPGVLYGHKQDAVSISVDPAPLKKAIKTSGMGRNTVFNVKGLDREIIALVKDVQIHPLRRDIVHLDFVEIRETDRIVVDVPVELVGKPQGVIDGGILQAVRRAIAVVCSPLNIPKMIPVEVSHLLMGQAVHISDVKFPEGTKSGYTGNFAIATVQAPKAEVEAVAAPVEGAEGVVAEGAEGAAPAEGAAAAAAPAAAAGDKKAEKAEKPGKK